ncbi:MAG: hypothetical protein GXY33_04220 [Phycisphaerae bacterium]|nr:hypothetical protein [Phycisphaerae bacterium]
MNETRTARVQHLLDRITRKWWLVLLFILLQFLPPVTAKPFEPDQYNQVIRQILSHGVIYAHSEVYPVLKVLAVVMLIALLVLRNRFGRFFALYAAGCYVFFAFGQSFAHTRDYGFGVLLSNLVMFLLVAAVWTWEAIARRNDFSFAPQPWYRYWHVPLAVLAFWYPLSFRTGGPDFGFEAFLGGPAAVAFCLMTPVFLSLLLLNVPRVNAAVIRITALAGTIIGFWNAIGVFDPHTNRWNLLLHVPLMVISVYALVVSLRLRVNQKDEAEAVCGVQSTQAGCRASWPAGEGPGRRSSFRGR